MAALYATEWHRARITHVDEVNKAADIFFIDYGTTSKDVPLCSLKLLDEKFSLLSAQAFEASLAGVMPMEGTSLWSSEAKEKFFGLIRNALDEGNHVHAQVVDMSHDEEKKETAFSLRLFVKDTSVEDILVKENLAVKVSQKPEKEEIVLPMWKLRRDQKFLLDDLTELEKKISWKDSSQIKDIILEQTLIRRYLENISL